MLTGMFKNVVISHVFLAHSISRSPREEDFPVFREENIPVLMRFHSFIAVILISNKFRFNFVLPGMCAFQFKHFLVPMINANSFENSLTETAKGIDRVLSFAIDRVN